MTDTWVRIGNVYYLEEDLHKVFQPRIAWTNTKMGAQSCTIHGFECQENCPI